ncbi:Sec63 Brl domain-containing protein [Roridomyces roridus]|uniref:Sec63 Brl domain-containing protein n=1 Tax=Roridomyces roridus TaxID=1738132 RepID=A0AAD7BJY0_9AGAR|nr:Sec63 Brl domain-containing protein [Roridomyces roridus]
MAQYTYDEGGNMAAYFVITFLALLLTPLSFSLIPSRSRSTTKFPPCECAPCIAQRKRMEGSKLRMPGFKASFVIVGWSFFAFLCWKVAGAKSDGKVYDPFEILGISPGTSEKEIKSTFKQLSRLYLTDPVIRENLEKYGNPDGRQELTMGIALPPWIVASQNNIWVLGVYGILFGGVLPWLVGRWWFGNREQTKDGVHTLSASVFFRTLTEDATEIDVVRVLAAAYAYEKVPAVKQSTEDVEAQIKEAVGPTRPRGGPAMILLYAYLHRIDVAPEMAKAQSALLLQTPVLLNALLTISQSRNWLTPTLAIMRLHAFFTQALPPTPTPRHQLAQLPRSFTRSLKEQADGRATDVQKALGHWGRVEIVDASFRVIGERIIVPASIVYLVVKLRVTPPGEESPVNEELDGEAAKRQRRALEEREQTFLASRRDAEDPQPGQVYSGGAHAPFWPSTRKPSWWFVLADDKSNRVVVPPLKITDVPFGGRIQFQAPQSVGLLTWRIYIVSDSFVGEEVSKDIVMKIDDVSALTADEQGGEDDISDPEEDTIAGQMAAMRGGNVKKSPTREEEESDDESSTDDDKSSEESSDSDSD